jgi:phage shock protein C
MKKGNENMTKRLYRSEKDVMIFGICGGLAEYFGIDPVILRVAAVIATIATGVIHFTVGYFICYVIVPQDISYAKVVKK